MSTDYESFLHVTHDGRIWWLREDAIRLGAGFLPICGDNGQSGSQLRAPNQQALVAENTLIGALGDERLTIPKPTAIERDGMHYVDAADFLEWLAQYISLAQAQIAFPSALISQVRITVAKAAAERPPQAPQPFDSLTLALEDWFDKPIDALPDELRLRVETDLSLIPWENLSADGQRSIAAQWDYQNDPALEDSRTADWEAALVDWDYWQQLPSLTAQEFCILRHVHDPREFEGEQTNTPDGIGKTLGARVSDDVRIIHRSLGSDSKKPIAEWVIWAQQQSWNIPAYLRFIVDAPDAQPKPKGHLNHDPQMQKCANEIAAEELERTKRLPTRNAIAKLLARKLNINTATVERRIRNQWKR
jgi:hypothetical protein